MKTNSKIDRQYIPIDLNPIDAQKVSAIYTELLNQVPKDSKAIIEWIAFWEELHAAIDNAYSRAQVATTIDTADANAEKTLMNIIENILPITEHFDFQLSQKLLNWIEKKPLPDYYDCFIRYVKNDVDLFRAENIPLGIEEKKLINEYEKITGAMTAEFRGKELTMQQAARYLEDQSRETRKEAFDSRAKSRKKVAAKLDALFDQMITVRQKIAKNAGFDNFRDYQFKAYHRFDYGPQDCLDFHSSIEEVVVPFVEAFAKERMQKLKLKELRPWDTQINPDAKKRIEPFKDVSTLIQKCQNIFNNVDSEFGKFFKSMTAQELLDLESRKGKAPGGYCTSFNEEKLPFIFMNAAGTKRDVETLLHEGGHAFHYFLSLNQKLKSYHHVGMEFAEVASMSMELLSRPFLNEFYSKDELQLVLNEQLRKVLEFFPFMAMIDAFQHWVYTTESPNAQNRKQKWAELEARFQPNITWDGYEDLRDLGWQYPHVFSVPFYYIEYGIAQLGALSIWRRSLTNYKEAVRMYKDGLKKGGSRPLPELFSTIGAEFGMNSKVIRPLVEAVNVALS